MFGKEEFAQFAIGRLAMFFKRELEEDRQLTAAETDWLEQFEKELKRARSNKRPV